MIGDLAGRNDFIAGPLHVSPGRRRLEGPAGSAHLQPIEMRIFLFLLDARGSVVTREDLFACAWGAALVGDDSLNRAIGRVRKVVFETAPGACEIETIPRTGYRLIGEVLKGQSGLLPQITTPFGGHPVSRRTIAIGGVLSVVGVASAGLWQRTRRHEQEVIADTLERGAASFRRDTAPDAQRSIELLRRAVERQPNSARAWGLLACAYAVASRYTSSSKTADLLDATKLAARKSLLIEPHEPNAEAALTSLEGSLQTRASTEARYRSVLNRDPRNGFALDALVTLLQGAGYTLESMVLNDRVLAVEPLAPVPLYRRALKLWILNRVSEADQVIARARELWPSHPAVWNAHFMILAFTARAPAALSLLDDRDARPATLSPTAVSVWRMALEALDRPTKSRIATAREEIMQAARLSPGLSAYGAMIMSALGEADSAYSIIQGFLLSKGTVVMRPNAGSKQVLINFPGWRETQWLFVPPTALVRKDERFGTLAKDIGLDDYWRARGIRPDFQRIG